MDCEEFLAPTFTSLHTAHQNRAAHTAVEPCSAREHGKVILRTLIHAVRRSLELRDDDFMIVYTSKISNAHFTQVWVTRSYSNLQFVL